MNSFDTSTVRPLSADTRPPEDDSIDIGRLLGVIWRGRLIIAVAALLAGMIGFYHVFFVAVPKYRATAHVALETQGEQVVDITSVVSGISTDFYSMRTQLQVLRSRQLIAKLVQELDLTTDPEFNSALAEPSFSLRQVVTGIVRDIRGGDITPPQPASVVAPEPGTARFDSVVSRVRSAIYPAILPETYILMISATTTDRQKSQLMANTLAELYIQDQVDMKYEATENATAWLSQRVVELEAELEERENALKLMRSETDVTSQEELLALNTQTRELRDKLSVAQSRIADAEADILRLTGIIAATAAERETAITEMGNPTLLRLQRQVSAGDPNAEALLISQLESMLDDARQQKTRAEFQAETVRDGLADLERSLQVQSEQFREVQQVEREIRATRTLYETFLTRLKETSVQRGLQQADSRLLSPATQGAYIEPRKLPIIALYALIGALAAIAYLFLRQFSRRGIMIPNELESITHRPVLGEIPVFPLRRRSKLLAYLNEKRTSVVAEAYRNLRTSLLLSKLDKQPKLIMMTSSVPAEGKTTNSISLAHNLADLGKRVLLVECDIRRQTLSAYFESTEGSGSILDAMTSDKPLREIVVQDPALGADVLLGDTTSGSATDVFSSERFAQLLETMRAEYDFIIIDTPPVLIASDARIIGQQVDAVLYTVAWDRTTKNEVLEGMRLLEMVNVHVDGMVLSMINPKGLKRYGYGDGYGAYSAYAYRKSGYYQN